MNKNQGEDHFFLILMNLLLVASMLLFLPAALVFVSKTQQNKNLYPKDNKTRIIFGLLLILPVILFKFFVFKKTLLHISVLIVLLWCISLGIVFLIAPLLNTEDKTITVKYLKKHINPLKPKESLKDKESAFVGQSMVTDEPIYLNNDLRKMHMMTVGSTGSGKTTLLDTLFESDLRQNVPIIIIDPKGNHETIEKLKLKFKKYQIPEDKFKIFSLPNPNDSYSYNPLKYGTPVQIKDRLMGALTWSEPYYKTQADVFILRSCEVFSALKKEITIASLIDLISSKDARLDLKDEIKTLKDNPDYEMIIMDLYNEMNRIQTSDLSGLYAQLVSMNALELGGILSPETNNPRQIDLVKAINNSEVIFFSLNKMDYGETAPMVGKLLLQELKSIASQIDSGNIKVNAKFISVQIDEAASYLTQSFIEFLKMARSSGFAISLYFQSMADLNAISPDFKEQVQSNCITKFILRTDDPTEAEFWASVCGTIDTLEQSYQVEGEGFLQTKTGMGNLRKTKNMKIEHDVFKQISIGQSVLIQKSPHKVDLLNLYRS